MMMRLRFRFVGQATSNRSTGAVRVEINQQGACTGRRVGDTVVPWIPKCVRIKNNTPIQNVEKTLVRASFCIASQRLALDTGQPVA
jgi:hypothetical protein